MSTPAETQLDVLLHGEPVATLRRRATLELHYAPEVVARLGIGALCLSAALPVSAKPYKDPKRPRTPASVEWWCEGLLPEGETRTLLESRFGIRRGDTFGLLAAIGAECAGAVSFANGTDVRDGTSEMLDASGLAAAVDALPSRPLGVDDDVRVSLGGMQAKLLLTRTADGAWSRPTAGAPSTHLLKPDPRDLGRSNLVDAEALTLRAAVHAGLAAAAVELVEIGGRHAIVVERYDRTRRPDGSTGRLHQEDACQALGLDPTLQNKYESATAGSVSFRRIAGVLRDHSADPDRELVALGRRMTLGSAVGDSDGHARNYSVLIRNGTTSLAPAYDVAPTHLFVPATTVGLFVDGQAYLRYVTPGHLVREMRSWGLPQSVCDDVVAETLAALPDALRQAAEELSPLLDLSIARDTVDHVERFVRS